MQSNAKRLLNPGRGGNLLSLHGGIEIAASGVDSIRICRDTGNLTDQPARVTRRALSREVNL